MIRSPVIPGLDSLTGSNGDNLLSGNSEADTIRGKNSNDTIEDGAGAGAEALQLGSDVIPFEDYTHLYFYFPAEHKIKAITLFVTQPIKFKLSNPETACYIL